MRRLTLLTLITGVVTLGACAPEAPTDPLVADLRDLCRAVSTDADLNEQEGAFFDRAHDAIHELAERVTENDPGIGATLLEAKQGIEAELDEQVDGPVPSRSFERLVDATNEALNEIELERVSC